MSYLQKTEWKIGCCVLFSIVFAQGYIICPPTFISRQCQSHRPFTSLPVTTTKFKSRTKLASSLKTKVEIDRKSQRQQKINHNDKANHNRRGDNNKRQKNKTGRNRSNKRSNKYTFRKYLRNLQKSIRDKRLCAEIMDLELQRMDLRYKLSQENESTILIEGEDQNKNLLQASHYRNERINHQFYNGKAVQPDVSCYAMVANSYAKSNFGLEGAKYAENVLRRCLEPNAVLLTAVVSAWAKCDVWGDDHDGNDQNGATKWLKQMEQTYNTTRSQYDAPDVVTYTTFIDSLSKSKYYSNKEIARKGMAILQRMKDMALTGDNIYAQPNIHTYVSVMKCLVRNVRDSGYEPVERLLREIQESFDLESSGDDGAVVKVKPVAICYSPVLNALSKCNGGIKAARHAISLYEELLQKFKETNDEDYRPDDSIYTPLFTTFTKAVATKEDKAEVSSKVDKILNDLKEIYGDENGANLNALSYTSAINVKVLEGNVNGSQQGEELLRRMPFPDTIAYQCVIKSYARDGNAKKAEELLLELDKLAASVGRQRQRRQQSRLYAADRITHAAVIHAWIKVGRELGNKGGERNVEAAIHATHLLKMIVQSYRTTTERRNRNNNRDVDRWLFNGVIRLWSITRDVNAGKNASEVINLMEEMLSLHPSLTNVFEPTIQSYTYVLDAWGTSGRDDVAKKVVDILDKMKEKFSTPDVVQPNNRAISSALLSITKSTSHDDVEIAGKLFKEMLRLYKDRNDKTAIPSSRVLVIVLSMMLQNSEKEHQCKRAIDFFRDIRDICDKDDLDKEVYPNTITYNCLLNGLAKHSSVDEIEDFFRDMKCRYADRGFLNEKPDLVSYSSMIDSYINSGSPDTWARAEKILSEVEELHENGDLSMKPDIHFINNVIRALVSVADKDPQAAEKAHEILKKSEWSDVLNTDSDANSNDQPDCMTYSLVCQAYANSNPKLQTKAAEKTEEILSRVEQLTKSGQVPWQLDSFLYSTVILAHVRSKDDASRQKAEDIYHRMVDLYVKSSRAELKPTTRIVNMLLGGWATSNSSAKVYKILSLFEEMIRLSEDGNADIQPDIYSYNWIILACAVSSKSLKDQEEKRDYFEIALDKFKRLHHNECDIIPNAKTYENFFQTCKVLLPSGSEREKLSRKAFDLARKNGLVTDKVLVLAYTVAPTVIKESLTQVGIDTNVLNEENSVKVKVPDLPKDWRRNIF